MARRLASRLPGSWDRRVREIGKMVVDYRGARATGGRGALYALLGRYTELASAAYGEGRIVVDTSDQEIGRTAFIRGDYERTYMAAAIDCIREAPGYPMPGPVFIDAGANIGVSTLDALLHFGFEEAICFEPDSRNLRLLRMNLAYNQLEDRVHVHELALSDGDGTAQIRRSPDNFGDTRLITGTAAGPEAETVEKRSLDSLVADGTIDLQRVGLLWIDVQGHDPFVLAGARRLIRAGVPVVAEYWPEQMSAGSGLAVFEELVAGEFGSIVDLRRRCDGVPDGGVMNAADVPKMRDRYRGNAFTDLLLMR